jgi:hypothetical protein
MVGVAASRFIPVAVARQEVEHARTHAHTHTHPLSSSFPCTCFPAAVSATPLTVQLWAGCSLQIDKHRLLGELSAIPQITATAPYLPFPAPLITLDEHALSDLRLWWTSNITASANGPPFPEIDPGGKISCCSQFGLFGQAAKQHPRELYVLLRNWAIVHPHKSSKILELVWPLLFRRTLVGAVRAASMWRSARVRAFCKPWKCTCQGFSERFGSRPGTIGDVTEEEEHWWDHGIWDEWAQYVHTLARSGRDHRHALFNPVFNCHAPVHLGRVGFTD